MEIIFSWIISNYIELVGFIAALIYLYFSVKQNIWLWPLGILTSLAYIFIFYNSKFYADMGLQVYYVMISIYGWYNWVYGKTSENQEELPVTRLQLKPSIILFVTFIALFVVISYILTQFTDSPLPYWDSFTTSLSIIATWMLAKKIIEHWLLWVVIDVVSMFLYFYKDIHLTAILFIVYTTMAVVGYVQWKKSLTDPDRV